MTKDIYLDNSMTTRPSARAISKMLPILKDCWGLPTSPHKKGYEASRVNKDALSKIYSILEANKQDDFVFTSSGAEAVNQVIQSIYYDQTLESGKNHLITSHTDEAPAIMAIGNLEEIQCMGKMVDASSSGMVTKEIIAEAMTPRTALVSLSYANGLTGVINPVHEIGTLCEERGALFHLDATHVLGKIYFDFEDTKATHITFNGDNLHAPQGTGGLWIKGGRKCHSLIQGGIEQAGLRAGSFSIAHLAALAEALEEAFDTRDYLCTEIARLRNKLEKSVLEGCKDALSFFQEEERVPHITALGFPGVLNEALLFNLNKRGLFGSIGGGSFQQIGLILENCGIHHRIAHSAISFSLSRETTEEEIDRAIAIIIEEVAKLRNLSSTFFGGAS